MLAAYTSACSAPAAATDVAIARLNATTLQLTWNPVVGATGYEVWGSVNAPYFTPPAGVLCAQDARCTAVTGTTHAPAALGDPDSNHAYVVLSSHRCGATSTALSNRTGEFDFGVVPGE